jgi:hypothetical protein
LTKIKLSAADACELLSAVEFSLFNSSTSKEVIAKIHRFFVVIL